MKPSLGIYRLLSASLLLLSLGWTTTATAAGEPDVGLIAATVKGDVQQANDSLLAGADPNAMNSNGMTALMLAAQEGNRELAELLVAKGADVNAKSPYGITALMLAAEEGRRDVAELLLAKGADVNAKTTQRHMTALMWAAMEGRPALAALLISHGADINAKAGKDGYTAGDFARESYNALDRMLGGARASYDDTGLQAPLPAIASQ